MHQDLDTKEQAKQEEKNEMHICLAVNSKSSWKSNHLLKKLACEPPDISRRLMQRILYAQKFKSVHSSFGLLQTRRCTSRNTILQTDTWLV